MLSGGYNIRSLVNTYGGLVITISAHFSLHSILVVLFHSSISPKSPQLVHFILTNLRGISSLSFHNPTNSYQILRLISTKPVYIFPQHNMCFTEPSYSSRNGKRYYKEEREVVVQPRPVRHHHQSSGHRHSHSGTPARTSYTSVTRTVARPVSSSRVAYVPSPRQSTNSYRRSGTVIVDQRRRSTQYVR
jgi:hypothetical protein